jgi:hypothetical protein
LDDVKIRLSEFPGRANQVDLVKFLVPEGIEMMLLLAGLVQIFMKYQNFEFFRLHDNFTIGSDARKYRHLKKMWKDVMFQKNELGYVLDCRGGRDHHGVVSDNGRTPEFAIVDANDYAMIIECFDI